MKSGTTRGRRGGTKPDAVKTAAMLTIVDAPRMTAKGRRAIAAWLLKQGFFLVAYGQEYATRFTAHYQYRDNLDK